MGCIVHINLVGMGLTHGKSVKGAWVSGGNEESSEKKRKTIIICKNFGKSLHHYFLFSWQFNSEHWKMKKINSEFIAGKIRIKKNQKFGTYFSKA